MTPADAARLAGTYTKHFGAGAFAFPTRKELEADPSQLRSWPDFVAVAKVLTRDSTRKDFTGRPFVLQAGKTVYTHIARTANADIPLMADEADYVIAYLDDTLVCDYLRDQGYGLMAATVSASSELKGVFTLEPRELALYPAHELATATHIKQLVMTDIMWDMLDELPVEGYRDDWPLYSDGSWGALCLKGFYPEDPGRDMKPVEMNKKWQAEHPEDMGRSCDWTTLAADCPSMMHWLTSVPEWQTGMERVRLLQMSGRNGKGGSLGRHTDIADKAMGTADGQIARFHLPLVTDPAIQLHTWDLTGVKRSTHLQAGQVYYLDARKPHAVTNPTGVDRVHLVVDVVCNQAVRDMIAEGYNA